MIMVSEQRTQLLGHPLCMALVRNKWNSLGRYVYYGQLILYLLFVGLLTNFVLDTPAPYRQGGSTEFGQQCSDLQVATCSCVKSICPSPSALTRSWPRRTSR